jgi:excisionase family DNA binding protein
MVTQEQTYAPTQVDARLLNILVIDSTIPGHPQRYDLAVSDSDARVELPDALSDMLRQAAAAMSEGLAVTVRPQTQQLTTTQVAELLGVTRPTAVKLLESGAVPYSRVGSHRRVALPDVLRYRDARRERQYGFIASTQTDDEPPREQTLADLKRIRHERATAREQSRHAHG